MQKRFRSVIAIGGLAGLAACGDDVSVLPPADPLVITGAPVTAVSVGALIQLSANRPVTWASSAATVATVDGSGLVTVGGAGTASITATSTDDPDDKASVTITVSPAVRSVTVSPPNAVIVPTETFALVANVDADAGVAKTVTWASNNTAVATVNGSGVVTGVSPGAATITATSSASTTVTGAAAITVRQPIAATISIQNITQAFTPGNPTVNNDNVVGTIDVNMNVDPGEQVVQRVEVLIDGNVACARTLSGAQSESLRIAAAFADVEGVIVSCQINTARLHPTTNLPEFSNGNHTISARAVIAGGTDVTTSSIVLVFNNPSGVNAVVTTNNGSNPVQAINLATGLSWLGGSVTIDVTGVSFAGTTFSTVTVWQVAGH